MRKLVLALMLAVGLTACDNKETPAVDAKPTVKIGFIAPLSGDNAALGINCRNGFDMALSDLAQSNINYKVLYEDDAFMPARSAMAANKLINIDKVDFLFVCSAVTGGAVVDISYLKEKPQMTICSSAVEAAIKSPYSFIHWTPPHKEGEKVLEIIKSNNAKKVLFITEIHPGAMALGNGAIDVAKKNGIDVVSYEVMGSERIYTDIIQKAERENADLWVLTILQPGIDIALKRMREQGVLTPYTSIEIPSFMNNKTAFEGVEYVDAFDGQPDFLERYKKEYNTNNTYAVPFSYDAMIIINKAYENFYKKHNRLPNTKEISLEISSIKNHSGVVGDVVINKNGIIDSNAVIKTIKNGKAVLVEEK